LTYRILSQSIYSAVLDPARLPPLLRSVRGALFPNNMPGSPSMVAPSSEAELLALRRRCANALWAIVPKGVGRLYFGSAQGALSLSSAPSTPVSAGTASVGGKERPGDRGIPVAADQAGARRDRGVETGAASAPRPAPETAPSQPRTAPTNGGQEQPAVASNSPQASGSAPPPPPPPHLSPPATSAQYKHKAADAQARPPDNGDDDDEPILGEIESSILDVFSDAYCNKHLVYAILELVLVRLMPELAEKGVVDLWDERLAY
jgi:hypothetical protein